MDQRALTKALGELVLELEGLINPEEDHAQLLFRKVFLKAQSVITNMCSTYSGEPANTKNSAVEPLSYANSESDQSSTVNMLGGSSPSVATVIVPAATNPTLPINPMQSAMLNHVILSYVFKGMTAADLLPLRPVCKKWDVLIMENILSTRNSKSVKVILDEGNFRKLNLSNLNHVLGNSRKFPIDTLELDLGILGIRDTGWENVHRFMDIHGLHIRNLIIKDCARLSSSQPVYFANLLRNRCANVEHLVLKTMQNDRFFNRWYAGLFRDVVLSSLKTIDFGDNLSFHTHVFTDLIGSAVNLESVTGQSPKIIHSAISLGKAEALRSLRVCGDTSGVVHELAGLSQKLTHLDIDWAPCLWEPQLFARRLKELLVSSEESLETLRFPAFSLASEKLKEIRFSNLKRLHVYYPYEGQNGKKDGLRAIFSDGAILANRFPHLNTLVLQLTNLGQKSSRKYFPGEDHLSPIDKLMTVQNLELDCRFTKFGLASLAKKFPNVRSIKAENIYDLFMNEDCIWYLPWAHLEELELRGLKFVNDLVWYQNLDSFFTGFSDHICKKLRQLSQAGEKDLVIDLKILQTKDSVRDLQNLKELKIVFDFDRFSNARWGAVSKADIACKQSEPLITDVTYRYAFNMMPKLHRVTFAYDHRRPNSAAMAAAFEQTSEFDFVTFKHEPMIY